MDPVFGGALVKGLRGLVVRRKWRRRALELLAHLEALVEDETATMEDAARLARVARDAWRVRRGED